MQKQYETPKELGHIWGYLVETGDGCWVWIGSLGNHDSPRVGIHVPGKRPHPTRAVRGVIHELATGQRMDSDYQRIYNKCGNGRCVRMHADHNELAELHSPRAERARQRALTEG